MTVVKINAITVPPDGGDELARRFTARARSTARMASKVSSCSSRPTSAPPGWW